MEIELSSNLDLIMSLDSTPDVSADTSIGTTVIDSAIDVIKVNGTALPIVDKTVNITVPTKTSDLTNDSGYITSSYHDSTKQNKLTAGTNITIENDVISASGGGSSTWGSITGTLSDQTDLQSALDAKLDKATPTTEQGNKEYLYSFAGTTQHTDKALINDMTSAVAGYTDNMVPTALSVARVLANKANTGSTNTFDANQTINANAYAGLQLESTTDPDTWAHFGNYGFAYDDGDNTDTIKYSELATTSDLATKQDTLTAGANITIQNNVISASGQVATAWGSITGTLSSQTDLQTALDGKVNTESGKGLSTNDFTTAEKTKLAGIATGATKVEKTSDITNDSGFITNSVSDLTNYTKTSDLGALATKDTVDYTTEVTNKPTIPTVNDATLTIQKNGTTVQTFTANSATNTTANITVPTTTSELTNNSNFVADASYVHTDNNFTTAEKTKLGNLGYTVLYNNTTGTNGTVTLSESSANFTKLKIFYRNNDSIYSSLEVYSPDGKKFSMMSMWCNTSGSMYIKYKCAEISGASITNIGYIEQAALSTIASTNNIYITRVEGYNN